MKRYAVLILVAGALIAAEKKKEALPKDVEKMQGDWTIVQALHNGESADEDKIKEAALVFKGSKFTLTMNGETHEVPFTVDPKKKPKTIDAKPTNGMFKDKTLLGIYEIKGDDLKMCFSEPGSDRPTEIKSEGGSNTFMMVVKRKKSD